VVAVLEKKLMGMTSPVRKRLFRVFRKKNTPKEVYGLLSEFLSMSGKQLRPALCLASCEAVGGSKKEALHAAATIEMFHNFTLIHDDIEDSSILRRGKPCLHIKYGLPLALNAGDGLFMMVWQEAMSIPRPKRAQAQKYLLSAFTKVLEGQARELGWYQKNKWDVSEKEYYQVVRGKTGALIAASCGVGAFLGGASKKTCKALSDFGMKLGVSFQIIDDVLNVVGTEKKYKKEIGGDIKEGKRTLITIWALKALPTNKRKKLRALLHKQNKSKKDVETVILLMKESGATKKALRTAEELVNGAVRDLKVLPKTRAKDLLLELAKYIIQRER